MVLILIIVGMFLGMVWNLRRMIAEDKEELAASKASIDDIGISALVTGEPGARPPGQVVLPGDPENMLSGSSSRLKKAA